MGATALPSLVDSHQLTVSSPSSAPRDLSTLSSEMCSERACPWQGESLVQILEGGLILYQFKKTVVGSPPGSGPMTSLATESCPGL